MAGYKSTARDLGGFICFEDEAGQGLRPPKGAPGRHAALALAELAAAGPGPR